MDIEGGIYDMLCRTVRTIIIAVALLLIGGASFCAGQAYAASPLYVRPAGDDALCDGTVDVDYSAGAAPACAFETVQKGIDEVDVDGQVNVGDGTYVEQLEIAKKLSLIGNGSATVIESPAVLTKSFVTTSTNKPIVWVHDADDVTLQNFVVDGSGLGNANARFSGVAYHNAGGLIDTLEIKDVSNTPIDGTQHGVGIYAIVDDGTPRHIDTFDCTIYGYQKNGMAFNGDDLTVEVAGNDVAGAGPTAVIAQNGIQVSRGATGIVRDNVVRDNWCTHPTAGCTDEPTSTATADGAAGILLYASGDSVEVRGNVVEDNQYNIWAVASVDVDVIGNEVSGAEGIGIAIWDSDQWTAALGYAETGTSGEIRNNTISGMEYGVLNRDYEAGGALLTVEAHFNRFVESSICPAWSDITLDASNNWWSDNTPDDLFAACGSIAYAPWLEFSMSADQASPEVGVDVEITASLRGNSDGDDTSAIGFMTDGLEVEFECDRGLVSEPSKFNAMHLASAKASEFSRLSDGIATVVLTGIDEAGPVAITATLDNQTTQLELDVVAGDLAAEGDGTPSDVDDGASEMVLAAADGGGGCGCRVTADNARPGTMTFVLFVLFLAGLFAVRYSLMVA